MNLRNPHEVPHVHFQGSSFQEALRFTHEAMGTVFEIYIIHDNTDYAHQAASEAFRELDRLEQELSRFIENSDVSRINRLSGNQSTTIGLDAFECIRKALHLYEMTHGAFDINFRMTLHTPNHGLDTDEKPIAPTFYLDENQHTIHLSTDSIAVDLGGIGKGWAIDRMADLLREWQLRSALIHGGMSSVLAIDNPPGEKGWPLTLTHPQRRDYCLWKFLLNNRSVSGSGIRKGQHIIDPRTGQPLNDRLAAWALAPDSATSDVLSTAFMIMTTEEIESFCSTHDEIQALIVTKENDEKKFDGGILKFGF